MYEHIKLTLLAVLDRDFGGRTPPGIPTARSPLHPLRYLMVTPPSPPVSDRNSGGRVPSGIPAAARSSLHPLRYLVVTSIPIRY